MTYYITCTEGLNRSSERHVIHTIPPACVIQTAYDIKKRQYQSKGSRPERNSAKKFMYKTRWGGGGGGEAERKRGNNERERHRWRRRRRITFAVIHKTQPTKCTEPFLRHLHVSIHKGLSSHENELATRVNTVLCLVSLCM